MRVTSTTKLYFPSANKALLSVTKRQCIRYIAFKSSEDALKLADDMNNKRAVSFEEEVIPSAENYVTVLETSMDDIKKSVSMFGVYLCVFEPNRIVMVSEFLGPGHEQMWSHNDMKKVLERSFQS